MYTTISPPNSSRTLFKFHLMILVANYPMFILPIRPVQSSEFVFWIILARSDLSWPLLALPVVSALHAACLSSLILLSSIFVHSLRPRANFAPSPIMEDLFKSTEMLALTMAVDSLFLRRLIVALSWPSPGGRPVARSCFLLQESPIILTSLWSPSLPSKYPPVVISRTGPSSDNFWLTLPWPATAPASPSPIYPKKYAAKPRPIFFCGKFAAFFKNFEIVGNIYLFWWGQASGIPLPRKKGVNLANSINLLEKLSWEENTSHFDRKILKPEKCKRLFPDNKKRMNLRWILKFLNQTKYR